MPLLKYISRQDNAAGNAVSGYFDISREPASLSFESFWHNYVVAEQPVIIEGIGSNWKAKLDWTEAYLQMKLADEPSAQAATLWYWMGNNALSDDYETPSIVAKTIDCHDVFSRSKAMRLWTHPEGNLSSWHYDASMVNVFNVQVTGRKKWSLISPETPVDCYPFTNFAILDGKGESIFKNKHYTRFELNTGDMLFLPALWFHQVEACEPENISLNWVFTKKTTGITSKAFKRDYDRYFLAEYFSNHKFSLVRGVFAKVNRVLPNYLRVVWQYPKLINTSYKTNPVRLMLRIAQELSTLVKVLPHIKRIKPYLKSIKPVKQIQKGQ